MIEPYSFVRGVTMALGAIWSIFGLLRTVRAARAWRERLKVLRIEERWWQRQVGLAVLRATVLDPTNLALLVLLAFLWSRPLP